ncbi:MAG: hypothetical protein D3924_13840 [Candidatus Electrothrix sp. AR4]|nr:hypothetical protein [Candidatus Electrothrix sp. AR4]
MSNFMKNLPTATVLLWIASVFGYWLLPEVFLQDWFLFPLVAFLSLLLSVSFWQVANMKRGKHFALVFVGIFIFNVSFLLIIVRGNYSSQQALSRELDKGIQPQFVEYLETAASGKRKLAAQIIYQKHGVVLPYKNDAGFYTLYEPSASDTKKHKEIFYSMNNLKLRSMDLASSLFTMISLLVIHIVFFMGFLFILVIYDRKGENSGV